jgi:hypothetical protein
MLPHHLSPDRSAPLLRALIGQNSIAENWPQMSGLSLACKMAATHVQHIFLYIIVISLVNLSLRNPMVSSCCTKSLQALNLNPNSNMNGDKNVGDLNMVMGMDTDADIDTIMNKFELKIIGICYRIAQDWVTPISE